ncbi:MAG: CPBP family intramembrane metalloprotease [Bacilli bacterium]|nr:CPBP family intramembrane metalloprotease [Bacilli bacterium]
MERSFKDKVYGFLILFFLFLIAIGIPFERFLADPWADLASSALRVAFFVGAIFIIKKEGLASSYWKTEGKGWVCCLPFFLIAFSNMFFLLIHGGCSPAGLEHLWHKAVLCLCTSMAEEMLFRAALLGLLQERTQKEWILILISAAIFSISHAVNFLSGVFIPVLVQMGYTFVLGLFLGMMYLRGGKLTLTILLHFLFNFVNNALFSCLYQGEWNLAFFITNISLGLIAFIYWLVLLLKEKGSQDPRSVNK